jgi:ribbon-helix-helix CopG family protein
MSSSKHMKMLSVRLLEPELRRLKSIAANRGVSVQEAMEEAIEMWTSRPPGSRAEPLDALEGSLSGVDIHALMRREREVELNQDQRWSQDARTDS